MISKKETESLRAVANVIEQLGYVVEKNPKLKLAELGTSLRKTVEKFEPILLPNDLEKGQLIAVLYKQLQAWKKQLRRNFKTPIATFAEEQSISLIKASTLKKKDDPISIIVANCFDEKISISDLRNAVNVLQEKGFTIEMKTQKKDKPKKSKTTSDDPFDILLNS